MSSPSPPRWTPRAVTAADEPDPVPSAGGLVAGRNALRLFLTSNIFFHNNDAAIRTVSHLVQNHGSLANNHVPGGLWIVVSQVFPAGGFRKALTLVCDDPMAALWVENSYTPELKQAAMLALGTERQIKFVCTDVVSMPAAEGQPQKASSGPKRRRQRISRPHRSKNSVPRPPGHA
ncbi:MAG: hypothetical protein ACLT8C_02720 [Akkermansia muciniphila]